MRCIVRAKVDGCEEIKIHIADSIGEAVEVVKNLLFMSEIEEIRITAEKE